MKDMQGLKMLTINDKSAKIQEVKDPLIKSSFNTWHCIPSLFIEDVELIEKIKDPTLKILKFYYLKGSTRGHVNELKLHFYRANPKGKVLISPNGKRSNIYAHTCILWNILCILYGMK